MRIVLTKAHAVHARTLPKGSEMRVTKELGNKLISLKVAKEFDDYTEEEKIEHIVEVAIDNEEKPKVKKVTKKKKNID